MKRGEIRLYEQAFRNRWEIPQETREALVIQLTAILEKSEKDRDKIAAARALLAAESQNQLDQHKLADLSSERYDDQLSSIARDLGIDPALIIDATAKAGGSPAADASSGADG